MSIIVEEFLKRNRTKRLNIHCVGDAMIDEYFSVKVNRISPEFPMPIMHSLNDKAVKRPGGIANVAHQFRHFNVAVSMVSFPSAKSDEVFLKHGISRFGGNLPEIKAKLPVKKRFLDGSIQVHRHDVEVPMCGLNQDSIDFFHKSFEESLKKNKVNPDVVIFSDYDKGFFYGDMQFSNLYPNAKIIVDPKCGPLSKWKGCTIFKPNAKEAEALSGKKFWKEQAKYLQNELECESVVITASGERVSGIWKNEFFCYNPTKKVNVESSVGAGDCFCAFFAMCIGHEFSIPEAAEIAYSAGSIYVQHKMNRPVCPAELSEDYLIQPEDLLNRDFKLVFTNGCFDILHKGHLETLKFAKSKGDKLVVALNSDESVKRLKGNSRPIVPLEQRMAVVANLKFVDFVVSFEEDDPYQILKKIKPDVLVKGGEYEKEKIIGHNLVKEIFTCPMIEGLSTTSILSGNHLQ